MRRCELDLGKDPWPLLEEGRLTGSIRWGDGPLREVSVRIRGAHSRRYPKKSLQVDLAGPGLPDSPPEGHKVRRLHLNADFIDPTLMRSALSYRLFDQVGAPAPLCRHTFLTVSGEPVGVYLALESVDADFCRRRGWPPGAIYYAVNRNANFGLISPFTKALKHPLDQGYRRVSQADSAALQTLVQELNLASERAFRGVADTYIDVDGYLRWLMVAVFVGNRDGFVHNYALYCHPETGQFRILPWDYDATWGIDVHGRPARLDRVPLTGWNKLSYRLMAVPEFRRRYRAIFLDALDGQLSCDAILPQIDTVSAKIAPWVAKTRQRPSTAEAFEREVERLRWWARERRSLLLSELEEL